MSTFKQLFKLLSNETLSGLKAGGFLEPTEIQKQSIKHALEGKDILACAKTGSGKTLAFLIPLLECLHKEKWSKNDGLGALIITPTRELAYQIFEVLRMIGQKHSFSAALIIGGKDLAMERKRIDQMNIIVCTPGRLQQHMEENPLFYADSLKMLIIDEADRILDMGFEESLNIIIDFLPKDRQCLLFSATQTNSVKDLARLSMKDPVSVNVSSQPTVDEQKGDSSREIKGSLAIPETLQHKYTVINLEQKLSFLWSFIKRHKKSKILVFIATCKQTRFLHDLFCRMKPGISINALHGGLHQLKRMDIYNKFHDVRHCVLLATDVAARGLDFPDVDWVVQLDCPENVNTYIHRAGRTARCDKNGRCLLVLMPNEVDFMITKLKAKGIPIEEIETRAKHLFWIQSFVESNLTRDVNLKEEAKRAFKCYIKSLLNSHFKHLFNPEQIDLKAFAQSLGLEVTPRIRVLERRKIFIDQKSINNKRKISEEDNEKDDDFHGGSDMDSDSDADDFLKPAKKQRVVPDDEDDDDDEIACDNRLDSINLKILEDKKLTKAKLAQKLRKKNIKVNKHIIFNND